MQAKACAPRYTNVPDGVEAGQEACGPVLHPVDTGAGRGPAHQRCTTFPNGCNATSLEIRARHPLTLAARGRSSSGIARRGFGPQAVGLPIARIGARHSYRQSRGSPPCAQRTVGVGPRREATRSRRVTSRPAGAQRGRQAARSADEPIPRRRSRRPCPAAVSHEDSPASRTEARRCRPGGLRSRVARHSRSTRVQGEALRSAQHVRHDRHRHLGAGASLPTFPGIDARGRVTRGFTGVAD